jgi:uncharacterized membrane protein
MRASFLENPKENVLTVVLLLSVVILFSTAAYTLVVPAPNERFTEIYLLSSDNGAYDTENYSTEFVTNETEYMTVGIRNQEYESVNYTLVVLLQRVKGETPQTGSSDSNTPNLKVTEQAILSEQSLSLVHNQSKHINVPIRPRLSGTGLRLAFLLYEGPKPDSPRVKNSYENIHLWVNVSSGVNRTG